MRRDFIPGPPFRACGRVRKTRNVACRLQGSGIRRSVDRGAQWAMRVGNAASRLPPERGRLSGRARLRAASAVGSPETSAALFRFFSLISDSPLMGPYYGLVKHRRNTRNIGGKCNRMSQKELRK